MAPSHSTAKDLAQRWMPGTRQGAPGAGKPRAAWMHPQDLVLLLEELSRDVSIDGGQLADMVDIAWLHDIIEDGVREDGQRVTVGDLRAAGIDSGIIEDVLALTQREGEAKPDYLARLAAASPRAKIVKCVDRVCNLREGKDVFKNARWARYVDETYQYIIPLADAVETLPGLSAKLRSLLESAASARSV